VTEQSALKIAVFIDFDNIEIGVKSTMNQSFDVGAVLEAVKERGEVITKMAYGDWKRTGDYSRMMTQHAVRMVQRNMTPGGDKNGADINLALDDAQRDQVMKQHGRGGTAKAEVTRFKGLGEMMPKVLWETTLNPATRRLLRVEVADHIVTDRIINELMGKDASARFRFIMERAEEARELDV